MSDETANLDKKIIDALKTSYLSDNQLHEIIQQVKHPQTMLKKDSYSFSGDHVKIGVVGDTHLNNIFSRLDFLYYTYERFKEANVAFVIQTGDIEDGLDMHRDQRYQLRVLGIDLIAAYVAHVYPETGIVTHYIPGNHDETCFTSSGADICERISQLRPDLNLLSPVDLSQDEEHIRKEMVLKFGWREGNIMLDKKNNCKLTVYHPGKGTAYALSYQIQKHTEMLSSDEKPKLYIIGHYHKMEKTIYRNVHILQAGTTQSQTKWMRAQGINAMIGSHILDIYIKNDGTIDYIKTTPFGIEEMNRDYKDYEKKLPVHIKRELEQQRLLITQFGNKLPKTKK